MGWLFSLFAEIGSNKLDAENFCLHFNNISHTLSNKQKVIYEASCYKGPMYYDSENWRCVVCLRKMNTNDESINVDKDHQIINEITPLLYEHLRTAPKFRYALVGVEVDEWRTYEELMEDIEDPIYVPGLVLSQNVWKKLGCPNNFVQFTDKYLWIPYSFSDID